MRGLFACTLAALLGLAGCGESQPINLTIGTGIQAFVPLDPGDPMEILIGPQGGVMLAPALRARNLDPHAIETNDPEVHWRVFVDDSFEVEQLYQLPFEPSAAENGAFDRRAIPIRLPSYAASTVGDLDGKRVTFTVDVTDGDGGLGTAETQVTATYVPAED